MYPRHAITPEHGRGHESIPLDCPRVTDRTAYIPELLISEARPAFQPTADSSPTESPAEIHIASFHPPI